MTQMASGEIKLYIDALGENAGDDYILRPKEHGANLPGNAGPLARILMQPKLQEITSAYAEADEQANRAQWRYKFGAKLAIWLVFLAIVLSSFSTALPIGDMFKGMMADSDLAETYLRLTSIAFLLFTLFVAFGIMLWMEWARPYENWNKARGLAEQSRKELFRTVFASDPIGAPVEGELKLLALKLEYFRRYLLGDQMIYYRSRAADFAKSERNTRLLWLLSTLVVAVILLVTIFIGFLSPISEQGAQYNLMPWFTGMMQFAEVAHLDRYILAGGITLAALFGAKLAIALLDKAKGNAIRYSYTYDNLVALAEQDLNITRQKALIGDAGAVNAFVNRIMAQISSEHQDWVKVQTHKPKAAVTQVMPAE